MRRVSETLVYTLCVLQLHIIHTRVYDTCTYDIYLFLDPCLLSYIPGTRYETEAKNEEERARPSAFETKLMKGNEIQVDGFPSKRAVRVHSYDVISYDV